MTATTRVLVVGGGIGGLALGAALGQWGIEADLVEIKGSHREHGVGIIQPGNALRALRTLGALEPCLDAGFAYEEWRLHDQAGGRLGTVPSALGGDGYPSWNGIPRGALLDILSGRARQAGATIRLATTLWSLESDAAGVDVVFSDNTTGRYDLVVGCDGIRSATRQRIFGQIEPTYTGYAVWRFTTERPAELTYGALYYGGPTKAGLVPLGNDRMYLFHVTAEPGNPWQDPSRYHELLSERLAGYTGLVGEVRERLKSPEGVVYSPIEETILPGPWHSGRVLLCGDAAHASAPHLAQGAAMAIEDAVVLAELLAQGGPVDTVLPAFMARRTRRCYTVQETSRRILMMEMNPEAAAALPPPELEMDIDEYLRQAV